MPATSFFQPDSVWNRKNRWYIAVAAWLVALLALVSAGGIAQSAPAPAAFSAASEHRTYLPIAQAAVVPALGANLLRNHSFEAASAAEPLPDWLFSVRAAAAATLARDAANPADGTAAARITISRPSAVPWDTQLAQAGIALRPDQTYQLSFRARADTPRVATVTLQQDSAPWAEYFSAPFDLASAWRLYSFTYRGSLADPAAALRFNLASTAGNVWMDDVRFGEAPPDSSEAAGGPLGQTSGWALIFQDEFAGGALDHGRWVNCYLWATLGCYKTNGGELEWYTPDMATVGGGALQLQARKQPTQGSDGQTYPYTSGLISSGRSGYDPADAPRFAFQYGYVEMRARVPAGRGFWSAFWLLRADRVLPWEIDIFEILGHAPATANMTVHYPQADGSTGAHGDAYTGPDFSKDYHTYGLEWSAEQLVWYIDGVARKRDRTAAHIPHDPMYLIANLAVGGDWPGPPDATTVFPSSLNIDYIRVWQPTH